MYIREFVFSDVLDADGEMGIIGDCEWIDKEEALDVVKHLVTVFQMSELQAAVEKYEESK